MATQNTLTERQQEIQGLIGKGLTPPEVAKQLGISDNAVYQQLRRIRGGNGGAKASARPRTKAGRKAASKTRMRTPRPAPAPALPTSPVSFPTPLQAIRARRGEITSHVKDAASSVAEAERALVRAKADHDRLVTKHDAELAQLNTAEAALTGSKPKRATTPKRKSSRKSAAKRPSSNGSAAQTGEPAGSSPPAGTPAAA